MKLSTKSRYGLRAMIELAQHYGHGPVLMSSISNNQGISRKYLHALLTTMKGCGLIRSIRGSDGGYALAKSPTQIKVNEIVGALEGSFSLVDCVDNASVCPKSNQCVTREVWENLSQVMEHALENLTLQDLVARKKEKETNTTMYHI